jgi:DNA-binding Xre family transcriptional regulator
MMAVTEKRELIFVPAKFMRDIRDACGNEKSLRDIAVRCRVSASTLSRIDNGMTPDMQNFIAICDALELQPGDYFVIARWQRIE